jgi:hypothetical protein
MKLRNKKTGEILGSLGSFIIQNPNHINCEAITKYDSLAELNKEWEDYEEVKDNNYWYIDDFGRIQFSSEVLDEVEGHPNNWMARKLFGNYFETREEAEEAVEKLKAWKRLKDKGFRFTGIAGISNNISFESDSKYNAGHIMFDEYSNTDDKLKEYNDDLMLLFGSEE